MRHDFNSKTRQTLAERAAYICTNPSCRNVTVAPHSDETKSLKTGEACHIHAASPEGPRFDLEQSEEQRRHISNGIWLCNLCSTAVDNDAVAYPPDVLRAWKQSHEQWLRNGGIVPSIPSIEVSTSSGLSLRPGVTQITGDEIAALREHKFVLKNSAATPLAAIDICVRLPEPIVGCFGLDVPPGLELSWTPVRIEWTIYASKGGSVTRTNPDPPCSKWRLQAVNIPAEALISFHFLTAQRVTADGVCISPSPMLADFHEPPNLLHFIDGGYSFKYLNAVIKKRLFVALHHDRQTRKITSDAAANDHGEWTLVDGFTETF